MPVPYANDPALWANYNAQAGADKARKQKIQDIGNTQEQGTYGQTSQILEGLKNSIQSPYDMGGVPPPDGPGINGAPVPSSTALSGLGSASLPPPVAFPDTSAADAGIFGHAKDQAAQMTKGSLTGLSDELSRRGMGGGGYEAGRVGQDLVAGTNLEGEASRGIASKNADLGFEKASQAYSGGITQRGQNIEASVATRAQDLQNQQEQARMRQAQTQALAQRHLQMLQVALGFKSPDLAY